MVYDPTKFGARCSECPLRNSIPVPGEIHANAKLWVVGEGPGHEEEIKGAPFVGESGRLLERIGQYEGFARCDISITNVLCCWLSEGTSKQNIAQALDCCRPRLLHELASCRAPVALALGGIALQGLTSKIGIFNWHGGPIAPSKEVAAAPGVTATTVVPALHPAHVLRDDGRQWMPVMMKFVQRAYALAVGRIKPFKWQHYELEPNADMIDALKQIREQGLAGMPVGTDTETFGEDPLRAPITCLSLATTKLGISTPWLSYFTKKTGTVPSLKE